MQEIQFGPHTSLSDHDADTTTKQRSRPYPTPGNVPAEIACIIAICLGLALVAQLLISPPPGV